MWADRRWLQAAALGFAPWMWFAVRDLGSVFDLIATGLPALFGLVVLGMVVYAAARRRRLVAVAAVSCLLAASVAIAGPWRPRPVPPPVRPFRIVAANVRSANPNVQEAALDALNQGGDLVLLFEFGAGPLGRPPDYGTVIRPTYSNQVYLSRFPARLLDRPQRWPKRLRAHRLEIDAPTGRVVVYVTHLVRPFVGPRRILRLREQMTTQRNERDALLASARTETAPVVLAGDFNTSDRTIGYRRITSRFRDAMRAGWGGPTYVRTVWRPFLLRIDHIFVPRDWCSARPERFALHGSDHRGLAVDVGPCPNL